MKQVYIDIFVITWPHWNMSGRKVTCLEGNAPTCSTVACMIKTGHFLFHKLSHICPKTCLVTSDRKLLMLLFCWLTQHRLLLKNYKPWSQFSGGSPKHFLDNNDAIVSYPTDDCPRAPQNKCSHSLKAAQVPVCCYKWLKCDAVSPPTSSSSD